MTLVSAQSKISLANILWTTDFSSSSEAALQYAAAIARRYDSKIYLAHVIRPDTYQLVPPEAVSSTLDQTRRYAEQQMGQVLLSGRLREIPHQVLLDEGEFWLALSKMIEENQVDLIVAATHGRTGIRKLILGSVAEEIFRLAPCPVLTVGPHVPREVLEQVELRQILYATDFAPASERAASYALSLAQEHQASLTLVHVVQETPSASPRNSMLMKSYFTRQLQELIPPEAGLWCDPELLIETGDPAETILRLAVERNSDLIVLGVRRSANFPGHLPPATAYKVVCQAHCPVLTVRG